MFIQCVSSSKLKVFVVDVCFFPQYLSSIFPQKKAKEENHINNKSSPIFGVKNPRNECKSPVSVFGSENKENASNNQNSTPITPTTSTNSNSNRIHPQQLLNNQLLTPDCSMNSAVYSFSPPSKPVSPSRIFGSPTTPSSSIFGSAKTGSFVATSTPTNGNFHQTTPMNGTTKPETTKRFATVSYGDNMFDRKPSVAKKVGDIPRIEYDENVLNDEV